MLCGRKYSTSDVSMYEKKNVMFFFFRVVAKETLPHVIWFAHYIQACKHDKTHKAEVKRVFCATVDLHSVSRLIDVK